jgi:hypothetical protein
MTYVAHFWRYQSKREYRADTLIEAVSYLMRGEDEGTLSSERVTRGPRAALDPEAVSELYVKVHDWRDRRELARLIRETRSRKSVA